MPLSVRLDKETENLLEKTAALLNISKSEIVKKALKKYCGSILNTKKPTPYELTKDLLGSDGSGRGDLSVRAEEILGDVFRSKR